MSNLVPSEKINAEMKEVTKESTGLLRSRYGLWFLGLVSFVESMLPVPIVTDPFMMAYIMLHRKRVVLAVAVTIITSLLGGLAAYIIAAFFIDAILNFLSADAVGEFNNIRDQFQGSSFILGFLGAITPIPFTLAAMVAGAMKSNILLFSLGVIIGRGIRYGIAAYLTYHYGDEAIKIIHKNIKPITITAFVLAAVYLWLIM